MLEASNIPRPVKGEENLEEYPDTGHLRLLPRDKDSTTYQISINSKAASLLGFTWKPDSISTIGIVPNYAKTDRLVVGRTDESTVRTVDKDGNSVSYKPSYVARGTLNFRNKDMYLLIIKELDLDYDEVCEKGADLFLDEQVHNEVYTLSTEIPEDDFPDLPDEQEEYDVQARDHNDNVVAETPDQEQPTDINL